MATLYRETVMAMPLGAQVGLFWQDIAEDHSVTGGRAVRKLPMMMQHKFHADWRGTLDMWINSLPKLPHRLKFPDIRQREVKL